MDNVLYIGVARVPDKTTIAEFACVDTRELPKSLFDDKLAKVLTSGRVEEHSRLTITDKDVGSIHYDSDPACLYLVITVKEYPQRTAFRLLQEARAEFEKEFETELGTARQSGLSKPARSLLKSLACRYNDFTGVDKIANVSLQVEQVKGVMQSNIQSVLKNQENLDTLLDSSDMMKNDATAFNRTANKTKDRMYWKNTKMKVILAVLILVLILVVAIPIIKGKKK